MIELKNELRKLRTFNEIDFQFAEWIVQRECLKTDLDDEHKALLFSLTLCLSFSANQQHSALAVKAVDTLTYSAFTGSDEQTDLSIDFSNYSDWPKLFPETIGLAGEVKPLILVPQTAYLYLYKYHNAEEAIAQFINEESQVYPLSEQTLSELNKLFEPKDDQQVPQPDWQKVAAFMALRNRFSVISGGPGTGKTTTVARILTLLLKENPKCKIDLVAPTGKAADRLAGSIKSTKSWDKRVNQDIPEAASTIHRYLDYHGGTKKFRHNSLNKTSSDILLVDEASMVSLPIFSQLLSALKPSCRVILLGDKDQLSAVETGNVLGDLTSAENLNTFSKDFCDQYSSLSSTEFPYESSDITALTDSVVKLMFSRRFDENSGVGQLASLINRADESTPADEFSSVFTSFETIELNEKQDAESLRKDLSQLPFFKDYKSVLKTASVKELLSKLDEFRVLCPTRKDETGVDALNDFISKEIFKQNEQALYHGRCIMIRQNNKDLGLFNGDVGVILHDAEDVPKAYFPANNEEGYREFLPTILPDFETAFAMTIHKSQGSEYKHVLIPIPLQESALLSKGLLYTAVTRASERVTLYSSPQQLKQISANKTERASGLSLRLG